ncbi:hypothetical protein ACFXG8_43005, partial [Kitasatospora indigofera]|uniref:hypothetical protein n=1 Tax=Kitasatospora indigofera TaxID=67307 RepID=UPI0036A273B8
MPPPPRAAGRASRSCPWPPRRPPDPALPDERQPGLYLRTYKVAADGSRHSESALQVADDARGS